MAAHPAYETIKLEIGPDKVGIITMNRPEALNAMTTQKMRELRDCFMQFYIDPNQVACLVITGSGHRGFCTGADLKERKGMTDETWRQQHAVVEQIGRAMMDCPVPIIAAVNGHAYAGGLEIALACDFVYAAEHARFALTVDPDNKQLKARAKEVDRLRKAGKPTLPTTIGQELATNPFLRWTDPAIRATLGMEGADDVAVFAEIRKRKDNF